MLSAPSELLLRNLDLFEQGRWLLVNPTDVDIFNQLDEFNVDGFHQYFDVYQNAQTTDSIQTFGAAIEIADSDECYDGVVIYLPKAKAHFAMLLSNVMDVVKSGGTIAVVGSNDGGIKSVGKQLKTTLGVTQKRDSARHCALWCSPKTDTAESFNIDNYLTVSTYKLNQTEWQIASLPGVFSHDALDVGTQVLLESMPTLSAKQVLDFACGAGVIGCYLAKLQPSLQISFSDINGLALYACQKSCELNELDARIRPSNGLREWQATKFDAIVTNPPFHTGLDTDYQITEQFITAVREHLNGSGHLYLVANRFLPYPKLIDKHLHRQPDLARTNKFSVYHASRH